MWEKKIACSGSGSEWEGRRGGEEEGGARAPHCWTSDWHCGSAGVESGEQFVGYVGWQWQRPARRAACLAIHVPEGRWMAVGRCAHAPPPLAQLFGHVTRYVTADSAAITSLLSPHHRASPLPPQLNVFTVNLTLRCYYYFNCFIAARSAFFT